MSKFSRLIAGCSFLYVRFLLAGTHCITVLLFLLIIKNYCIQDATNSEVDSKCKMDSFSANRGGGGGGGEAPSSRSTYGMVT